MTPPSPRPDPRDPVREAAQEVLDAYYYCRDRGSMSGFWTHIDDLAKALAAPAREPAPPAPPAPSSGSRDDGIERLLTVYADACADEAWISNYYSGNPKLVAARSAILRAFDAVSAQRDLERDKLRAVESSVIHTIGGKVEGRPTHAGNYLQRLRALVAAEAAAGESLGLRERIEALCAKWRADALGLPNFGQAGAFRQCITEARRALASGGDHP